MQLYIGGYAQGKLAYVQEKLKGQKVPVVNDLISGRNSFYRRETGGRDRAAIL